MKQRDITDVEDCMYKIEALLKEYNCRLCYDKDDKQVELIDNDTNRYEVLLKCT